MREQILDSFTHRDFDIMVVGNKYDLVSETNIHSQVSDIVESFIKGKVRMMPGEIILFLNTETGI